MLTAVTRKHEQIIKRLQSDSLDRSQDDAVLVEAADEGWTAVLSASLPLTRDHEAVASLLSLHRVAGNPRCCPRVLKIKAARNPVDVQHFAREIEARANSTFHRSEIDFFQDHATTSHELFFEDALPCHLEFAGR